MGDMDFIQAMNLLIQGKRVRKKCWDDETEHIFIDMDTKNFICTWRNNRYAQGFNDLHTLSCATGEKIINIFTDDWEEYVSTISFSQAFIGLLEGKKITRKDIKYWCDKVDGDLKYIFSLNQLRNLSEEDVKQSDWIIVE